MLMHQRLKEFAIALCVFQTETNLCCTTQWIKNWGAYLNSCFAQPCFLGQLLSGECVWVVGSLEDGLQGFELVVGKSRPVSAGAAPPSPTPHILTISCRANRTTWNCNSPKGQIWLNSNSSWTIGLYICEGLEILPSSKLNLIVPI